MSVFDKLTYQELDEIYNALKDQITETMIEAGLYHNHRYNGQQNMIDSYKAMLDYHPKFQRLFGNDEDGKFEANPTDIVLTTTVVNQIFE